MKLLAVAAALMTLTVPAMASAQGWGQPQPQPQQQQPGWGAPQPGGMNAGGLAPPSSNPGDPYAQNGPGGQSGPTEQELAKADKEDSGRGLEFFWLNAEVGGEYLGLQTFKANNLVDAGTVKTKQTGLLYGAGLGVRLVFITLGARFRLGQFSEWDLWTLNAELGIHIPLGMVEPYFTFGGGYASMGAFDSGNLGGSMRSEDVDIKGYDIRGGFGVDIYVSDTVSIGGNLTGEMLALTRPGVDPKRLQGSTATQQDVYKADGSSIGAGVTLTGVVGLHF